MGWEIPSVPSPLLTHLPMTSSAGLWQGSPLAAPAYTIWCGAADRHWQWHDPASEALPWGPWMSQPAQPLPTFQMSSHPPPSPPSKSQRLHQWLEEHFKEHL